MFRVWGLGFREVYGLQGPEVHPVQGSFSGLTNSIKGLGLGDAVADLERRLEGDTPDN